MYRPIIEEMSAVFKRLVAGPKTSGGYDDAEIERLLRQTQPSPEARGSVSHRFRRVEVVVACSPRDEIGTVGFPVHRQLKFA